MIADRAIAVTVLKQHLGFRVMIGCPRRKHVEKGQIRPNRFSLTRRLSPRLLAKVRESFRKRAGHHPSQVNSNQDRFESFHTSTFT